MYVVSANLILRFCPLCRAMHNGQFRPVDGAIKIAPKRSPNDVGHEKRRLRGPNTTVGPQSLTPR
jgi:hypothetical protein